MPNKAEHAELCSIEADDDLHEFGGSHGNKGNDFARFWLINQMLALAEADTQDYLFILEYVQDIALLDEAAQPSKITLYQLKKKENSSWNLGSLAGLTAKGSQVKIDSPLAKLLKSVLGFKTLDANAEFVSNSRFNVPLEAGGTAVSMDYLSLMELPNDRQIHFRISTATAHSITETEVPLHKIGLRYAPIEINDMRVHVIGTAHGLLKKLSAAHASQADAFVDALYAKLSTASRNTTKCKSWDELISKRGYSRRQFTEALEALQLLPDQQKRREDVLKELGDAFAWHGRDRMKIEIALTELARLKLSGTQFTISEIDWTVIRSITDKSESESWPITTEFQAVEMSLRSFLPNETIFRVRALAIYAMVQAWTNQTFV